MERGLLVLTVGLILDRVAGMFRAQALFSGQAIKLKTFPGADGEDVIPKLSKSWGLRKLFYVVVPRNDGGTTTARCRSIETPPRK